MTLPKHLYHYTLQQGLLGILESNKLWMTDILYLNDSSEFIHTLELVKSEIKKRRILLINKGIRAYRPDEGNYTTDEKMFDTYQNIENLCNNFSDNPGREWYVFSLSTDGDDLNQWRGYCPEGGFSIGFDTKKLSTIINNNRMGCKIVKCLYGIKRKEKKVHSILNRTQPCFESINNIEASAVAAGIYVLAIEISSYIKHESFKNEQEYRIIHWVIDDEKEGKKRKYREGKSMIIPYIEFSPEDDDGKLPISKIIVGPTPHPELSKLSIESFLKFKEYKEVEVEISNIPYRSW